MTPNFVIMGLFSSGKTTFLAALWHLIEADETRCRLRLDRYEGDVKYLNDIARAWRTFEKVPRTSQTGDVDVVMYLVDSETGGAARAFFPDLAGETFDTEVESRRCRPKYIENLREEDGILFFISVDSKQDSLSIVELNSMLPKSPEAEQVSEEGAGNVVPVGKNGGQGEDGLITKPTEWSPEMIPAQVRIVQVLMDVLRRPFVPRRRKLAVILSAWDLVESTGLSPEEWLRANMPLVDQFLRSNGAFFECVVYGVSAQGVDLQDSAAVQKAAKLLPSERITIIRSGQKGHDITEPLVWLMTGG